MHTLIRTLGILHLYVNPTYKVKTNMVKCNKVKNFEKILSQNKIAGFWNFETRPSKSGEHFWFYLAVSDLDKYFGSSLSLTKPNFAFEIFTRLDDSKRGRDVFMN